LSTSLEKKSSMDIGSSSLMKDFHQTRRDFLDNEQFYDEEMDLH
jgi:hypothetical protein